MNSICAWCRKKLGAAESKQAGSGNITHGICDSCMQKLFGELSTPLRDFLESFNEPILLIGPDPKVLTANKAAQNLFQKDLYNIEGYKGGEVIDCALSFSEKGCGKDLHCESCTIRNTVLETFATGKSFLNVPAYPDIQKVGRVKTYCINISTEKIDEFVILRIDHMKEMPDKIAADDYSAGCR